MSDQSISIVPATSNYHDRKNKANEILDWLVSMDVVKSVLSDCTLGENEGYAISEGAKKITVDPGDLPFGLMTNGLEVHTERQLFHTGGMGLDVLLCPSCSKDIANEDWDFLGDVFENNADDIICPFCSTAAKFDKYKFVPEWALSDLGFTFWNWPELSKDFLLRFQQRLGCEIRLVTSKI